MQIHRKDAQHQPAPSMPLFAVPDWALSLGSCKADPFELLFKGGRAHGKIAAKLSPYDCLLVTRDPHASTNKYPHNILHIDDDSVSDIHAAFVRHRKNGCIYCICLGSLHGTLVNGSRIPEHKPFKISDGCTIQFGSSAQQFAVAGAVGKVADDTSVKAKAAVDKENLAPQKLSFKSTQQQQQQQQHQQQHHHQQQQQAQQQQRGRTCSTSATCPTPAPQYHFRFERERLLHLLPAPCHRDGAASRLLQLPKHISQMLQVIPPPQFQLFN
jgi:hypothetical protein